MGYPSCSIGNCLRSSRKLLPDHDLETQRLHFDGMVKRGMRCASGLGNGFGTDQQQIVSSGRSQVCGQIADGIGSFNFRQEQEITQKRQFASRTAEDRSHPRPRNPGSADSGTLSRRQRLWNLGREVTKRDAALPGSQRLAKQKHSRFQGTH
jgi:hypothetical protein